MSYPICYSLPTDKPTAKAFLLGRANPESDSSGWHTLGVCYITNDTAPINVKSTCNKDNYVETSYTNGCGDANSIIASLSYYLNTPVSTKLDPIFVIPFPTALPSTTQIPSVVRINNQFDHLYCQSLVASGVASIRRGCARYRA